MTLPQRRLLTVGLIVGAEMIAVLFFLNAKAIKRLLFALPDNGSAGMALLLFFVVANTAWLVPLFYASKAAAWSEWRLGVWAPILILGATSSLVTLVGAIAYGRVAATLPAILTGGVIRFTKSAPGIETFGRYSLGNRDVEFVFPWLYLYVAVSYWISQRRRATASAGRQDDAAQASTGDSALPLA